MYRRSLGRVLGRIRSLPEASAVESAHPNRAGQREFLASLHSARPAVLPAIDQQASPSGTTPQSFLQKAFQQHRGTATSHAEEELSDRDFHRLSDLALGELMVKLEALLEELPDLTDADLEYQQGVLTLNLGSHGTYVINKQSPNKQIWMSSPVSGPVRYDFVEGKWVYKHDGHVFQDRLSKELQDLTGREAVDLEPEPQAAKAFAGYGADPT